MEWGSILCGYGEGEMADSPGTSDKAVLFSLPTETAAVFFNRELVPIFEVLAELPDGTGLLGKRKRREEKMGWEIFLLMAESPGCVDRTTTDSGRCTPWLTQPVRFSVCHLFVRFRDAIRALMSIIKLIDPGPSPPLGMLVDGVQR